MQDLRITLVQTNQYWEQKEANLLHLDELLENMEETDLVLLPEMFQTGFSMNASNMAETMEVSPSISWLKRKAEQYNCAFYTSLIIEEKRSYYNRGVFITPDGVISIYDKRKTFGLAQEDRYFSSGNKETIVHFRDWNIMLQICYDLRFPEICRNRIDREGKAAYDLLLYVANWPERRAEHWKTLLQARAIENQCYVAGVNRIGLDGNDLNYSGDSSIIDPLGNVKTCNPNQLELKTITLSAAELLDTRERLPFLKDV